MKSKKIYLIMTVLIIAVVFVAYLYYGNYSNATVKEGIQPYNLSENERYLLQSFGMEGNSQIISFNAPKEAISLEVKVYKLGDNNKWETIGGGGISIGKEREPVNQLSGTFTLQLKENHAIDFNINSSGRASYKTDEITIDKEIMVSAIRFLQEHQKIEMDKEIPVAIMVYDSGTVMKTYSLEDYFEPAKFEGMDLVQVVTLMFVGE